MRQRGFSLVSAIFLIVVIALVAGFMVTIGSTQRATSVFSIVGARAHFAALSGIEWGVHQVLANPAAPQCFASPTAPFALDAGGGFTVVVTCAETEVVEGPTAYSVFDLTASAAVGVEGDEDYFSRTLSASVSTAP